jgi:hypothetical protein
MRHAPRLAWLGMLLLWLSPIAAAAALHDAVGRLLGAGAGRARDARFGGAASWWAGFVAWATIIVVTVTMAFVVFVVEPPPVGDPDAVSRLAAALSAGVTGPARALIWIVLAACVYELEGRARRTND